MRRACSSCRGSSTSTRTPGSPRTPSPIASSRIRWRRRSAARRRSWRSTTRAPARRRRPSARSSRGCRSGGRPRPPTRPSTTRSASRSAAGWTTRSASWPRSSTRACRRPRRSWSSTSGSTTQRLFEAIRRMGERNGRLEVHCEDPVLIDASVARCTSPGATPRRASMPRPVRRWPRRSPLPGRWPSPRPPMRRSTSSTSRPPGRWRRCAPPRLAACAPRPRRARTTWP